MRTLSLNQAQVTYALVSLLFNSIFCEIEVITRKGTVLGQILKSRDGRPYYSFTGIPYAKPPIRELRFEAPKPMGKWEGVLNATVTPKICMQKFEGNSNEDCLYLNVYTPSTNTKRKFPVMFWIHGGAFATGHGGPDIYGPDYFMDKDVVLVSVNYRLGVLGFYSAEDDVIPGNYGMKDQAMALRWVRENIEKFGGKRNMVTIFGEGSGAASVGYHMLSPMSENLFDKAVLQSGTPLCHWSSSMPGVMRNRSTKIAHMAGCIRKNSKETLKCLKTLPARFLVDSYAKVYDWLFYPDVLFTPVPEKCTPAKKGFLCKNQLYKFRQQSYVPAIMGLNSAEGGMVVAALYNNTSIKYTRFRNDFNRLISTILGYKYFASDLNAIGEQILRRYFPSGKFEDNSHMEAVKMITDGLFLHGTYEMALKLWSPVYFYLYDYQNEFSYNTIYKYGTPKTKMRMFRGETCEKKLGVTHGDELTSLFKSTTVKPRELNAMDTKVSKRMIDIWTYFASSKAPTIDGTKKGEVWPKFDLDVYKILHINSDHPIVVKDPFKKDYSFWNQLPLLTNLNQFYNETEWKFRTRSF